MQPATAPTYSEHLTPLSAFGHPVKLNSYGCKLTLEIEQWMIATWKSAFAQLDEHAAEIPQELKDLFCMLDEIIMPLDDVALGDVGRNAADGKMAMMLSYAYMQAWSTATLAGIPIHEMTHQKLNGVYSGANLWLSEKAASANQLVIMKILGAPQKELAWIEWWGSDANQAAEQAHMEHAFVGPAIPAAA